MTWGIYLGWGRPCPTHVLTLVWPDLYCSRSTSMEFRSFSEAFFAVNELPLWDGTGIEDPVPDEGGEGSAWGLGVSGLEKSPW